jgi:hypothetical protein
VGLKGVKNLCFIDSDADWVNIAFYSEERVGVKILAGDEVANVRLMNGKGYGENQQKDMKTQGKGENAKV